MKIEFDGPEPTAEMLKDAKTWRAERRHVRCAEPYLHSVDSEVWMMWPHLEPSISVYLVAVPVIKPLPCPKHGTLPIAFVNGEGDRVLSCPGEVCGRTFVAKTAAETIINWNKMVRALTVAENLTEKE